MKFEVQKKGEKFLVVNDTTGAVRGVHITKPEADAQAKTLQATHNKGMTMASARLTPPDRPLLDDSAE